MMEWLGINQVVDSVLVGIKEEDESGRKNAGAGGMVWKERERVKMALRERVGKK